MDSLKGTISPMRHLLSVPQAALDWQLQSAQAEARRGGPAIYAHQHMHRHDARSQNNVQQVRAATYSLLVR